MNRSVFLPPRVPLFFLLLPVPLPAVLVLRGWDRAGVAASFGDAGAAVSGGAVFRLDLATTPGDATRVGMPHPEIFAALIPGAELLLDECGLPAGWLSVVTGGGLRVIDAGPLKRAHELEAIGAVQIGLAVTGQTPWTGGFAIVE